MEYFIDFSFLKDWVSATFKTPKNGYSGITYE